MRTLLVVTDSTIKNHEGEEYDDYIVVKAIPSQEEMPAIANEIRNKIRGIVIDAQKENEGEAQVKIEVDATPPYDVILVSLVDTMGQEEKLNVVLPERLDRGGNKEKLIIESEEG